MQVANESEPGRQARHFRTINEPPGQDANQTGLLLNISGGGDILAGLLKRLTMEKDVADQTAGVFKAWRDAQVVGLAVEEGAHIEVVERERHWCDLDKTALNAYAKGHLSCRNRAGNCAAHEPGIGGLGAVLRALHGTRKAPWLIAHPGLHLAGPDFRAGKIGRLEGLTDIRESRLDTVNLRSVCRAEHESVNDFHEARFPLCGPCYGRRLLPHAFP